MPCVVYNLLIVRNYPGIFAHDPGIVTAKVGWLSCIEFLLLIATPETVERLRTYSRAAFIDIR